MNKAKSFYLELMRIIAATYVFIYHVFSESIDGAKSFVSDEIDDRFGLPYFNAHFFVIVFFVLSGYLISMSANKEGMTFKKFIIARLGRLYSVMLPVIIFSFLLAMILVKYGYDVPNYTNLVARFFMNLFFLSQCWTFCSTPPLDNPIWSVHYELFYYFFFGISFLVKKWYKYLALAILAIISFPKILLLFPPWLLGSILYFVSSKYLLPKKLSFVIFLITFSILTYLFFYPENLIWQREVQENNFFGFKLFLSWNFRADYVYSLIVALNMYAFFGISESIFNRIQGARFDKIFDLTNIVGNCTYTLYLFHVPLLFMYAAILPYDKANGFHVIGLILLVFVSVYFIARQTEWKIIFWRNLIKNIVEFFEGFFYRNRNIVQPVSKKG